jgi:succinate dehydrogenase / fumarate reductase cytochrome b subunit
MPPRSTKPVFLNLLQIKLPWMGLVSILHRITGVLLFLAIPLCFYLLGLSLDGEAGFNQVVTIMQSFPFKLFSLALLWVFLHHLLAGIRFLLIDLDVGVNIPRARQSAVSVFISGLLLAPIAWMLIL